MKSSIKYILPSFILLLTAAVWAGQLPDLEIDGERNAQQAEYLGISTEGPFRLSDVASPLVLIQIFSMYCPHCQAEAPHMMEFFQMLKNSDAGDKVKFLAIGAGNTAFEVHFFKDKYGLAYPMFPDPDFVIHSQLPEVGTPYYMLLETGDRGEPANIILEKIGQFYTPEEFLKVITESAASHK